MEINQNVIQKRTSLAEFRSSCDGTPLFGAESPALGVSGSSMEASAIEAQNVASSKIRR